MHLLYEPGPVVVGGLLDEVERLHALRDDMLVALEDAKRVLEWGEPEPKPVLGRVQAAIAKARGGGS